MEIMSNPYAPFYCRECDLIHEEPEDCPKVQNGYPYDTVEESEGER
jgi:hypothetical protein